MVDLTPAPSTLGLSSPALGPWFTHDDDTVTMPQIAIPSADLSVSISLPTDTEWRTPANATRSYAVATATRPDILRHLRQANGTAAFTNGNLVVLLTLLPEVEMRLWTLSQPIPSPDGTALPADDNPARPRIRYLALEIPAASAGNMSAIENLRSAGFPADIDTTVKQATFIGLKDGTPITNAKTATNELCRPEHDTAVALKNRTGGALSVNLWSFDYLGRPLDPGAVANWWTFLASTGIWDNLWADEDETAPATANVAAGRIVHITNAHEGPLTAPLRARLNVTDLTLIAGATDLYQVGTGATPAPAIALTAAPTPDDAPLPRIAALPLGNYADPATATPFSGWTGAGFPAAITRDFVRVAFLDMEQHIVGLTRADSGQAEARLRISPARNTAATPFLLGTDAVSGQLMASLTASAAAIAMTPVMDNLWGQATPPASFGTDALPDTLDFSIHALAGDGTTSDSGSSVENQIIAVHFASGSLPAGAWIRLWTHGLDTQTGSRFRQDGAAALVDASGEAHIIVPIPDGTAAPTAAGADPIRLSFDVFIVTDAGTRYFSDVRYDRPAAIGGSPLALPAAPTAPPNVSLWICEQGSAMVRGSGQYTSGQSVLAVPNDAADPFARVDLATLDATDVAAATLVNAAGAGDTLIITEPAFGQTPAGDLTAGPNGANLFNRTRNLLNPITTMGQPAPSQERREVVALDQAGTTAVIGSTPGRAKYHEAPPPQLTHAGVPAAAEIHGPGLSLAGPAIDQVISLIDERRSSDLVEFLTNVSTPLTATADPGGTTTWTAVLETTAKNIVGEAVIKAASQIAGFTPGQSWVNLKTQAEAASGQDIDALIDTATFDDDTLATAVDRAIIKTKNGVQMFANSLLAAIGRAEDFIYIETPALDGLSTFGGTVDVIAALTARASARAGLRVVLCVPEKYLPDQTKKLEDIRKAGIASAMKTLEAALGKRAVLFSPKAGPGRPTYMASTSIVVDDAILISGTAHLWRRGLSFDSALSVGLFDENVTFGRPTAVRTARRQLMANALGLALNLVPDDPADFLSGIAQLNDTGGMQRVKPGVYLPKDDLTTTTDLDIWNPDGGAAAATSWLSWFGALTGGAATEFNNAIR